MKKNDNEILVCKNKKCKRPLPVGYKHRYCEACRNQYIQKVKNIGKVVGAVAIAVVSIAPMFVNDEKNNPNEESSLINRTIG